MANQDKPIQLLAVGDLQVMAQNPASNLFKHTGETLSAADVTFGNCEWPYAEEAGDTHPVEAHINDHFDDGDLFLPGSPDAVRMMGHAGFNVMSVANNHTTHGGYRAFLRTLELLRESAIAPVGGGANIAEARQPAIVERNGVKIAFLACTSCFLPGTYAGRRTPGIVPLRRHSYTENPAWETWGIDPDIRTLANREDLDLLCASIRDARAKADIVVMSCHWGILEHPTAIGAYQREAARAFIDAGADLILGHGPLPIKGFETYRGKAIFYSIGKFMMISQWTKPPTGITAQLRDEARQGLAASVTIDNGAITAVHVIPVWTGDDGLPTFLKTRDEKFGAILADLEARTSAAGLNGKVDANGRVALL